MALSANGTLHAFVITPFTPEFGEFYRGVIAPVLDKAGFHVEHARRIGSETEALKHTIRSIYRAALVVVDVTIPNATVLYELGIAQGMMKPTVLIGQHTDRVPFLAPYPILEYSKHYKKVTIFKRKLREIALHIKNGSGDYRNPVVDFLPALEASAPMRHLPAPDGASASLTELASAAVRLMRRVKLNIQQMETLAAALTQRLSHAPDDDARRVLVARVMGEIEQEATALHDAWPLLAKAVTFLIMRASIRSAKDREAAALFYSQLAELHTNVAACQQALAALKALLPHAPADAATQALAHGNTLLTELMRLLANRSAG